MAGSHSDLRPPPRRPAAAAAAALALVAAGGAVCAYIAVYRQRRARAKTDRRCLQVKASWLVDKISPGPSELAAPFLVAPVAAPHGAGPRAARPSANAAEGRFGFRVTLAATGQVCASGSGFVGVPQTVDLSRFGFGRYVLEAWPELEEEGDGPRLQERRSPIDFSVAEVEKKLASFEEELAKVRRIEKAPVTHVDGWPPFGSAAGDGAQTTVEGDRGRVWSGQELLQAGKAGRWVAAVDGLVYDVGDFAAAHPGGRRSLMQSIGRDCTENYMLVHRHVDHRAILGCVCVGRLGADRG